MSALELSRSEAIRNWPGLLKRLATSRALDCLRQRQREWNRWTALRQRLPIDRKTLEPTEETQAGELATHLRQALSELDDRQAQVFCLASLEGWHYQEIAQHLGLTMNHVGVLLNRFRGEISRSTVNSPLNSIVWNIIKHPAEREQKLYRVFI